MGVAVGDDAADLGVGDGVRGGVLDGCPLGHQSRDAVQSGIHTVGGDLLDLPGLL